MARLLNVCLHAGDLHRDWRLFRTVREEVEASSGRVRLFGWRSQHENFSRRHVAYR